MPGLCPSNIPVPMQSNPTTCPSGVSALLCARRTGVVAAPGLGQVTESYLYVVLEYSGLFLLDRTIAQLTSGGKGNGRVRARPVDRVFHVRPRRRPGLHDHGRHGLFAGASGRGTVRHNAAYTLSGGSAGTDTWSGSLVVPRPRVRSHAPDDHRREQSSSGAQGREAGQGALQGLRSRRCGRERSGRMQAEVRQPIQDRSYACALLGHGQQREHQDRSAQGHSPAVAATAALGELPAET